MKHNSVIGKGDYVMDDFEATAVTTGHVRLDLYDDEIEGETRGRYTKLLTLDEAMGFAILLHQAINRAELLAAKGTKR